MKKIYCAYCGTQNKIEKTKCKRCQKKLNLQNHPWKDYFHNHIKDDLKNKTTDQITSLLINYIKSNFYGVIFSITIIATTITTVTTIINENQNGIVKVTEKPAMLSSRREISLNNHIVQRLYTYNQINKKEKLDHGFYQERMMNQADLTDQEKLSIVYRYIDPMKSNSNITSCEQINGYKELYHICLNNPEMLIGKSDYHIEFYSIDMPLLITTYRHIFGSSQELPKTTGMVASERQCEYSETTKEYLCYSIPAGYGYEYKEATKLVKAIKDQNKIELYDYIIFYKDDKNSQEIGVYKDINLTHIIGKEYNESLIEQGQLYKHTYRQDSTGNYYWYSSEPIMIPLNEIN